MSETDFQYEKEETSPPLPDIPPPPGPPSPPPIMGQAKGKFTCPTCRKTFNTNEELTMHTETEHQSPKKKV